MVIASSISNQVADMKQNRAACALSGAALLAWSLVSHRSGLARGVSSLAGVGLLYHAWTGRNPVSALRALGQNTAQPALEPLSVSDSVRVTTGRDATYRYWRDLQNLVATLPRVEAIEEIDIRRSRWRVKTAEGESVEWESEIVDDDPGKAIYWRSIDSPIPHEGVVRFDDLPQEEWGTEITVEMRYMLPTGVRGEIAKRCLGNPQQDLTEHLQLLKRLLDEKGQLIGAVHEL